MATHILSVEEQKHSLLGKKKQKKTIIKNVLPTPYENYWPLVNSHEAGDICKALRKHLNIFTPVKETIPWNIIKSIPKEERRAFRSAHIKSPSKAYRSCIVFGINQAMKLLEEKCVNCILISNDIDPKFLVKHILDMCVLRNIPVLVIPNLKQVLKEVIDVPSSVIAFKKDTLDCSVITERIQEIYINYAPPQDHVNVQPGCLTKVMEICQSSFKEDIQMKDLYLYRKTKERVFVPELSQKRESTILGMKNVEGDFISIDSCEASLLTPIRKSNMKESKVSYKTLLLKRVTNDKNRDIKKIERLKKKSK